MAETNGADAAAKKVVMITGGTGLVGSGIKEFVDSDAEVSSYTSLPFSRSWVKIGDERRPDAEREKAKVVVEIDLPAHTFPPSKTYLPLTPTWVASPAQKRCRRLCARETHDSRGTCGKDMSSFLVSFGADSLFLDSSHISLFFVPLAYKEVPALRVCVLFYIRPRRTRSTCSSAARTVT